MSYTTLVPAPSRQNINPGLSSLKISTLTDVFGPFPGLENAGEGCLAPCRNPKVAALLERRSVGPFSSHAIKPFLAALDKVFASVKTDHPDLFRILGTEGAFCYRRQGGSGSSLSNHAAGVAIDMKVGGILPARNAQKIPSGFLILYNYMHDEGLFWAQGYRGSTDPMHFEVADETLRKWKAAGNL